MKICDKDCFHCKYEDCVDTSYDSNENGDMSKAESERIYQAMYRDNNRERVRKLWLNHYYRNREEILAKQKEQRKQARIAKKNICFVCGGDTGENIIYCKKKYFCSEKCLGVWLVEKFRKDIQIVKRGEDDFDK